MTYLAVFNRVFRIGVMRYNGREDRRRISHQSPLSLAEDKSNILMHRNNTRTTTYMLQEVSDESSRMALKMNIAETKTMVVDNTRINVNNVLTENNESYAYLDNSTASRKRTRIKRYNEESCQDGRPMPNTDKSYKATLSST